MKKILLYGAGNNCKKFLRYAIRENINILSIIDKNKYGNTLGGINILPPDAIKDFEFDEILVTPEKNEDIIDLLLNKYNIHKNKIKLPGNINIDYMIPQIKSNNIIIFGLDDVDSSFYFVFYKMIKEKKAIYINFANLLECKSLYKINNISHQVKLFIFYSCDVIKLLENGFFDYLRFFYPNAKKFLWITDPCDDPLYGVPQLIKEFKTIENLKKVFNYCYTYHSKDAKKYDLIFYPQFYPNIDINIYKNQIEYDIFFVGFAKKRTKIIYDIYKKLTQSNLICRFFLLNVPIKERNVQGIFYIDDVMAYDEVLKEINKTKCILEVCNEGDETSIRYAEAIIFNKKLLLNDDNIKKRKYYNKNNMQIYHSADDIDIDWFYSETQDYNYLGDFDTEYVLKNILKTTV